eukprot:4295535-Alexandrium_andersonii.AAC.1
MGLTRPDSQLQRDANSSYSTKRTAGCGGSLCPCWSLEGSGRSKPSHCASSSKRRSLHRWAVR